MPLPMPSDRSLRALRTLGLAWLLLAAGAEPAMAYIGPGAGFAAAGSVLVLIGPFLLQGAVRAHSR